MIRLRANEKSALMSLKLTLLGAAQAALRNN